MRTSLETLHLTLALWINISILATAHPPLTQQQSIDNKLGLMLG